MINNELKGEKKHLLLLAHAYT